MDLHNIFLKYLIISFECDKPISVTENKNNKIMLIHNATVLVVASINNDNNR